LLAIQNAVSLADHKGRIGQTVEVLVEGPSKNAGKHDGPGPRQLTGRTPTDHIVVFAGNERLTGRLVSVRITEATAFTLFGDVLTGEYNGAALEIRDHPNVETSVSRPSRLSLPVLAEMPGN